MVFLNEVMKYLAGLRKFEKNIRQLSFAILINISAGIYYSNFY